MRETTCLDTPDLPPQPLPAEPVELYLVRQMVLQDSPRVSRQGIERAGAVGVAAVHGEIGGGEAGEKSGIAERQYLRKFHLLYVNKKVSSSSILF